MAPVYILRHGQAEGMAQRDSDRALTSYGRQEAEGAARHLQEEAELRGSSKSGLEAFSRSLLVVASPYLRAQQTADIVCESLHIKRPLITSPYVTPDQSPLEAIAALDRIWTQASDEGLGMQAMLVVAHLPMVSRLINHLVWGEEGQRVSMGTAYLAKLEQDLESQGVVQGLSEVAWVKPPQ